MASHTEKGGWRYQISDTKVGCKGHYRYRTPRAEIPTKYNLHIKQFPDVVMMQQTTSYVSFMDYLYISWQYFPSMLSPSSRLYPGQWSILYSKIKRKTTAESSTAGSFLSAKNTSITTANRGPTVCAKYWYRFWWYFLVKSAHLSVPWSRRSTTSSVHVVRCAED